MKTVFFSHLDGIEKYIHRQKIKVLRHKKETLKDGIKIERDLFKKYIEMKKKNITNKNIDYVHEFAILSHTK